MNAVRLALAAAWVGVAALSVAEDKKPDEAADVKKKLVGRWEVVKGKDVPKGATIEFKKDGKVAVNFKREGEDVTVNGTYTVKGKSFTMTTKRGDKERTQTIKITKLTDKALEVEDAKGEALTFKRLKKDD